jgi:hypothetical protein
MPFGTGKVGVCPAVVFSERDGRMATAVVAATAEPLGIVIHDGGAAPRPPRILMWFWANEEEAQDEEEWRER